jgi:hypothetical protein
MADGKESIRPDGSVRKAVKIRPGYTPPSEQPKYVPRPKRDLAVNGPSQSIPSPYFITRPYYGKFPSEMSEEELSLWLKQKLWLKRQPS